MITFLQNKKTAFLISSLTALTLFCITRIAVAHSTGDLATAAGGGFFAGFMHPVSGLDHVVAMMAVGLWGAFLGAPAIWLLPVVFPMVMALGGVFGIAGIPLPGVEILIALSGIVLGLMVALKVTPPIWVAAVLVGIFAIFHGYAHGVELPKSATPLAFSLGFVISTGLIHIGGISFGLLTKWPSGLIAVRVLGAGIILVGIFFLKVALVG